MTKLYFVRHAQPVHGWEDDRTRPLTVEGKRDREQVEVTLQEITLDAAVCSPYTRSIDTIAACATAHGLEIRLDERLRERQKGKSGNEYGMFRKRWDDFDYHEEGGESIHMVQERNVQAVKQILQEYNGKSVLIGTHGTALSTILNYYEPSFCCKDFLRIIDYMPYIICLTFEDETYVGKEELLVVEKEFKGAQRADKQ